MVWAYDEETGEQAYKPVVQLFRNETKEWYHVFVDGEEIICTGGHPFYVIGKGFVPAKDLKEGEFLQLADCTTVSIYKITVERLEEAETTYNFEVEDFHTYYVSESNVLVHNRCWSSERKAYWKERSESIDAELYNQFDKNNVQYMKKGKAPIGPDGRKIELHHVYGKANDMYSYVEITRTNHIAFHKKFGYKNFVNIFDVDISTGVF